MFPSSFEQRASDAWYASTTDTEKLQSCNGWRFMPEASKMSGSLVLLVYCPNTRQDSENSKFQASQEFEDIISRHAITSLFTAVAGSSDKFSVQVGVLLSIPSYKKK